MTELDSFFLRAAETERKLPAAFRRQKLASWPEYKQEWSAYGWDDYVAPLSKATPADVTCFEQALVLGIKYMDEDDRRLVWAIEIPGQLNACTMTHWCGCITSFHRMTMRNYWQRYFKIYSFLVSLRFAFSCALTARRSDLRTLSA